MKDLRGISCLNQEHIQLFLFSLQANAHKLSDTSNSQEMGDQDSHSSYTKRIQNPIYSLSKATVGTKEFIWVRKNSGCFSLKMFQLLKLCSEETSIHWSRRRERWVGQKHPNGPRSSGTQVLLSVLLTHLTSAKCNTVIPQNSELEVPQVIERSESSLTCFWRCGLNISLWHETHSLKTKTMAAFYKNSIQ